MDLGFGCSATPGAGWAESEGGRFRPALVEKPGPVGVSNHYLSSMRDGFLSHTEDRYFTLGINMHFVFAYIFMLLLQDVG